jgi:hypothetical protein
MRRQADGLLKHQVDQPDDGRLVRRRRRVDGHVNELGEILCRFRLG